MHNRKFSTRILARATEAADVSELCSWQLSDLFAAVEGELAEVLSSCGLSAVRSDVIESLRLGDGSPHFRAEEDGEPVAVYVLCVSSVNAQACLNHQQYEWVEAHPGAIVYIMPCVVQRVRPDYARCVVDALYAARAHGKWATDAATCQFLPEKHGCSSFMGGGGLLKMHTLVRETANSGTRIYPYVEGLAHNGDMAPDMRLLASGVESPLLLVLTQGRREGSVVLRYGDFYSDANPVNELEVFNVVENDSLSLMDARGACYRVRCAEVHMFGHCFRQGMHLRCAVSLLAASFTFGGDGLVAFVQRSAEQSELHSVVQHVSPVNFCGLSGYCLQCGVNPRLPELVFNVYVFEPLLGGRIPRVGDFVCAGGRLYAVPDSLVESSVSWADSPITASAVVEDARELEARRFEQRVQPLSPPLALIGAALLRAGCRFEEPVELLYRFGRPEFRVLDNRGQRLCVMVDTITNTMEDARGYRRRFHPDRYPSRMKKMPGADGSTNILYLTLHVNAIAGSATDYKLKCEAHGFDFPLGLPERISHLREGSAPRAPITEADAARLFAQCMSTQRFDGLLPHLREDVYYHSETAALEFFSKPDMLRHLRSCFDTWVQHHELPNITFKPASMVYQGARRPCTVARQNGELISATIFTVEGFLITGVEPVAPDQCVDIDE